MIELYVNTYKLEQHLCSDQHSRDQIAFLLTALGSKEGVWSFSFS